MKFVLIICGITYAFLILFVVLKFKNKTSSKEEEWCSFSKKRERYLFALTIVFVPLVVLVVPFVLLIDRLLEYKEQKKLNAEREKKQKKKFLALYNYHSAIRQNNIKYTHDYANIASTLFSLAEDKKYDKLLSCLNALTLQPGWVLNVDICKHTGLESNSHLMVTKDNINDFKIWEYIDVKDEPMAVWQAYLLHSLWHVLPHHWHGEYNRRYYIFTSEDISNIEFYSSEERRELISIISDQLENLTPEIAKYNDLYYVTCCYWSDWNGLVRELIEIKVVNDKVVSIFNVEKAILFKYNCGIIF